MQTIQPARADTVPPTGLAYVLQHYWFCMDKHISSQCCDSGKRFGLYADKLLDLQTSRHQVKQRSPTLLEAKRCGSTTSGGFPGSSLCRHVPQTPTHLTATLKYWSDCTVRINPGRESLCQACCSHEDAEVRTVKKVQIKSVGRRRRMRRRKRSCQETSFCSFCPQLLFAASVSAAGVPLPQTFRPKSAKRDFFSLYAFAQIWLIKRLLFFAFTRVHIIRSKDATLTTAKSEEALTWRWRLPAGIQFPPVTRWTLYCFLFMFILCDMDLTNRLTLSQWTD